MASEKINTNKFTRFIYWVIGAVALVGIIFIFWPREDTHTELRGNLKLSGDAMSVIDSYLQWADGASKSDMSLNHSLAANGLTKMADALSVLSAKVSKKIGDGSKARIDTIKEMSSLLVANPKSLEHADMIIKAFTASREVLTSVQTYLFPEFEDELVILKQKISVLEANKPMLEQKPEIVQSFQQVAVLLKRMTDEDKSQN